MSAFFIGEKMNQEFTISNGATNAMMEALSYSIAMLTQEIERCLRMANTAARQGDNDSATEYAVHVAKMTQHRTNMRALLRAIV